MKYPGLAYLGSGTITGLYGLNETIHDQKSIGLQHLYIDNYEQDFIYSAVTVVKYQDKCYFGDRIKPRCGHPVKQKSFDSYCEEGYIFTDVFIYDDFIKKDYAYCVDDNTLSFNCDITNKLDKAIEVELSNLIISNEIELKLIKENDELVFKNNNKTFKVKNNQTNTVCRASIDAPSGFMYHGIQDILFDENIYNEEIESDKPIAVSSSKIIRIEPKQKITFSWIITSKDNNYDFNSLKELSEEYWNGWLNESDHYIEEATKVNLIALKSINMDGFLPADLTGHYFANNDISFYIRDALHGARAFMYSGHFKECEMIVDLIKKLPRKANHELYQRYNSKLEADEGANNNVFSQIDVIGYLLRVVVDYYQLTNKLLMSVEQLVEEVNILDSIDKKEGLYGPEGGVNEGVYGPAFITSTNIFIAGGLLGLLDLVEDKDSYKYIKGITKDLIKSINKTLISDGYFAYGYVNYHNQLIKRYDTPQLFGASLGYPTDGNYKRSFYTLTKISTYYDYGFGYSEQEYHDGPWLFNTAFAAQNALIFDDIGLYTKIMNWIEDHKNSYGLLPEAIDSRNEDNCFINPLMWANAEYISAKYAHVIKKLRKG